MGSSARIEGLRIIAPERDYDFSAFAGVGLISSICVQAVHSFRSTNEREVSRRRTNLTMYNQTVNFLRFVDHYRVQHVVDNLSSTLLISYEQYLKKRFSVSHQAALQAWVSRIARFAIDAKLVASFQVPRGLSIRASLATTKGGKTLADCLSGYDGAGQPQSELNRQIVVALKAFCWATIERVHERSVRGKGLRLIASNARAVRFRERMRQLSRSDDRQHCVATMVMAAWQDADGLLSRWRLEGAFGEAQQAVQQEIIAILDELRGAHQPEITLTEITEHLSPSHHHTYAFMPLFALVGINPLSILEARTEMLVEDENDPKQRIIIWEKGRAKGELISGPFPIGARDAQTIPRAWEMLRTICDGLRPLAAPSDRDRMFLVRYRRGSKSEGSAVHPASMTRSMDMLMEAITASTEPEFAILRHLRRPMRLKLIRTTAINLVAVKRGFEGAQLVAQHQQIATTQGYLNNSMMRSHLNDDIERGQAYLLNKVRERPILLPPDALAIAEKLKIDVESGQRLADDDFNTGFGLSLHNGTTYIIDTPLNCLRMLKYAETIETARETISTDNPDRWQQVWLPRLDLLEDAIEQFPATTRAAARTLAPITNLKFPVPM